MTGISQFLADWEAPDAQGNFRQIPLLSSAYGNINSNGSPGIPSGYSITPHHQLFRASLEIGVRALVVTLTAHHGLVTYTSCEGHDYAGLELLPSERHVGLVPRSHREKQAVLNLFAVSDSEVRSQLGSSPVELAIIEHMLEDEAAAVPVLDFVFAKAESASWGEYFRELGLAYNTVLHCIEQAVPVSGNRYRTQAGH